MDTVPAVRHEARTGTRPEFDAVVIGAGVAGLYQLYRLRELGLRVRAFEAGSAVGGTWYWNRYPGARFDSESWTYGYSFSKELLEEWEWEEHFSAQPHTERYLNHVADKFDLRRDIQFNSRVAAAHWREETRAGRSCWRAARAIRRAFSITAIGVLSAADDADHPRHRDASRASPATPSAGPRKASISPASGSASSAPAQPRCRRSRTIAKTVGHLTVFQRTPNWCVPLNNSKITPEEMRDIRARYPEILARCRETPSCYIHGPDPRKTLEVTPEDREAFWEKLYAHAGFRPYGRANFSDMLTDREANALASEFVARKIRERVNDPVVAEKLIPKNHGFGTRRMPLESGYYEVYNQPNVELVDVNETPIERITPHGIRTVGPRARIRHHHLRDRLRCHHRRLRPDRYQRRRRRAAQGGVEGRPADLSRRLRGKGFPNMLMAMGPHAGLSNYTRTAEYSVEWVTGVIRFATERGLTRIEATPSGVNEWTDHVLALGQGQLMNEVGSWMTGVNRNVEGKQKPRIMRYSGGHPAYREHCDAVAAEGYRKLAY